MVEKVFGTPSFAFFITKLPKASSTVLNESNADFSSLEALLFTLELHPAQGAMDTHLLSPLMEWQIADIKGFSLSISSLQADTASSGFKNLQKNSSEYYKKATSYKLEVALLGDPVGIRTQDPQLRRLLLYPTELPDRTHFFGRKISPFFSNNQIHPFFYQHDIFILL